MSMKDELEVQLKEVLVQLREGQMRGTRKQFIDWAGACLAIAHAYRRALHEQLREDVSSDSKLALVAPDIDRLINESSNRQRQGVMPTARA